MLVSGRVVTSLSLHQGPYPYEPFGCQVSYSRSVGHGGPPIVGRWLKPVLVGMPQGSDHGRSW